MIRGKHSSRKAQRESGQAVMEAVLLLLFTTLIGFLFFGQVTNFMRDSVLGPISQMMADTIRFGNHNENGTPAIDEDEPDTDLMNPFHGNRNDPLHL